ncbi:MAG: hypothetical protein ACOYXR_13355 [Nitrospirota bacterium]
MAAGQGGLIRNYDVQLVTKTGRTISVNVSIVLVPSPRQAGPIIVHLFRDTGPWGLLRVLPKGDKRILALDAPSLDVRPASFEHAPR